LEIIMTKFLRIGWTVAGMLVGSQAAAQVTLYEHEDYAGRSFTAAGEVDNLQRQGFNDRASSVVVKGERWELCEDTGFRGRCVVLQAGRYPSLAAMALNDRVSSVRAMDSRSAPVTAPATVSQIDFYEGEGFQGRSFAAVQAVPDLRRNGFSGRASSMVVTGGRWEVCSDANFGGPCTVLRPGRYPSLTALGLNGRISSVRTAGRPEVAVDPRPAPQPTAAGPVIRIIFYEGEGFQGRSMTADGPVEDFRRSGFNDRASSVVVSGGRWEACQEVRYGGQCVVLRPGQYPSLATMGMNDRISSVRTVERGASIEDRRYAPLPMVSRDYGRRDEERVYQAEVSSVRAVVEDSGERCWVEPQQVSSERSSSPNVPGALLGAVIGGILGHQVGGGTGKDVATGVGVVAGAAIGGNSGRGDGGQQVVTTQNVQRCSRNPNQARAAYWDVTYNFRGQEYRVQMTYAPGRTVTVNEQGEPRG
jgi:uncharacterized protein YcfJ